MQRLRQLAALAVLDLDQVLQQPRPLAHESGDGLHPGALEPRQQHAPRSDRREQTGAEQHGRPRFGVGGPGRDADQQVDRDGGGHGDRARPGVQLGRRDDRDQEEAVDDQVRRPGLTRDPSASSATDPVARTSTNIEVHTRGMRRGPPVRTRPPMTRGPHGVAGDRAPAEQRVLGRRLPEQHQREVRHQHEPQRALHARAAVEVVDQDVGDLVAAGCRDRHRPQPGTPHSTSPRRMPSATAAARSETPSFS